MFKHNTHLCRPYAHTYVIPALPSSSFPQFLSCAISNFSVVLQFSVPDAKVSSGVVSPAEGCTDTACLRLIQLFLRCMEVCEETLEKFRGVFLGVG